MNKNREYEIFTKRLYMTLTRMNPDVEVKHDQVIKGNQIDVSWTVKTAGIEHLTIVECKNYNSTVDLNCYRQLVYNMDHLKARGVLVTKVGFQSGVIDAARERGDVSLLKVNFRKSGEATMDFGMTTIANLQYNFDVHTSTQWQLEILDRVHEAGQAGELVVFRSCDGATICLSELSDYLPRDVPDGQHTEMLDGVYIRLPKSIGETVRIESATYTVQTRSLWPGLGMTLRADRWSADVYDELTGESYETTVDDDF